MAKTPNITKNDLPVGASVRAAPTLPIKTTVVRLAARKYTQVGKGR